MIRQLTRDEYTEIETLADICMSAYSQNRVQNELKRLRFLSSYLPLDPYACKKLGEVHSWCLEASKRTSNIKYESAVSSARNALGVLRWFVAKDELADSGGVL